LTSNTLCAAAVGGLGAVGFAASKLDAGFSEFFSDTIVKVLSRAHPLAMRLCCAVEGLTTINPSTILGCYCTHCHGIVVRTLEVFA
jgi:hypothetical protein